MVNKVHCTHLTVFILPHQNNYFPQILLMKEEILASDLDFFLRFPLQPHVISPVDFLSNSSWGGIRSLSAKEEFRYSKHNIHCAL